MAILFTTFLPTIHLVFSTAHRQQLQTGNWVQNRTTPPAQKINQAKSHRRYHGHCIYHILLLISSYVFYCTQSTNQIKHYWPLLTTSYHHFQTLLTTIINIWPLLTTSYHHFQTLLTSINNISSLLTTSYHNIWPLLTISYHHFQTLLTTINHVSSPFPNTNVHY